MGIKTLRRLQMGRESTAGTAVAATTIWRGAGVLTDNRKIIKPDEDTGIAGGKNHSYIPYALSGIKLAATPVTFEQLPHILEMAILTATPTKDGAGSGYSYVYTAPTTAANTIKSYTWEAGDDQQEEEAEYCYCEEFSISGAPQEALMLEATLRGRQTTKSTFTASLTAPTVETALFGKTSLYIDAINAAAIGTTAKAATLLGFKFTYKAGFSLIWGDGALYFVQPYYTGHEATLELTLLYNDIGEAQVDAMIAETPQLFRIRTIGAALTGGTLGTKAINIDCAGKYEAKPGLDDEDGLDTVKLKVLCSYDPAATNFLKSCEITVVNELSTLP